MQPVKLGNPSSYYKTIKFLLQSETDCCGFNKVNISPLFIQVKDVIFKRDLASALRQWLL